MATFVRYFIYNSSVGRKFTNLVSKFILLLFCFILVKICLFFCTFPFFYCRTVDFLDDSTRQPQIVFSSRLPGVFPLSDAASLNHNVATFNPHDPVYVELLHKNGDRTYAGRFIRFLVEIFTFLLKV